MTSRIKTTAVEGTFRNPLAPLVAARRLELVRHRVESNSLRILSDRLLLHRDSNISSSSVHNSNLHNVHLLVDHDPPPRARQLLNQPKHL